MAEGYCEVDFSDYSDDADPVEFFNERKARARKPHNCSECGGPIVINEEHRVIAYKFEGSFSTERICTPCDEAKREFGRIASKLRGPA